MAKWTRKRSSSRLAHARFSKYLAPAGGGKPPLSHWQMVEDDALATVMRDLYYLVQAAGVRAEEFDAEDAAKIRKELETDLAELAEARREIQAATKQKEEDQLRDSNRLEDARGRVNRASSGDFGGNKNTAGAGKDGTGSGGSVSGGDGGSQIDPAEAARRANETPRAAPIKGKRINVPNP
jgi:hypothetical protein